MCSPSPPHAPPLRNVSSAIAVATFTGDLFCEGLLKGSFVQLCMNLVLDKLSCLEEVEALHAIILHSGERLYDRVPLNDFIVNLQMCCSGPKLTSAMGKMGIYQDVQHHVQVRPKATRALCAPLTVCRPSLRSSRAGHAHARHQHRQTSPNRLQNIQTIILSTPSTGRTPHHPSRPRRSHPTNHSRHNLRTRQWRCRHPHRWRLRLSSRNHLSVGGRTLSRRRARSEP